MMPGKNASRQIAVVLNPGAGSADAEALAARIHGGLSGDCTLKLFIAHAGDKLAETLDDACAWLNSDAHGSVERLLVGAGGDGTINAVAQRAWEQGLVFGPLPAGTFNLIARGEGFGTSLESALPALLNGSIIERAVPLVNERLFLANAGLGMYPVALEEREDFKRVLGRNRIVAIVAGFKTLISRFRLYRLTLQTSDAADPDLAGDTGDGSDHREHTVVTPALFICANAVQLERLGIDARPGLGKTHLTAISADARGTLDILVLAWHALTGTLGQSSRVHHIRFRSMRVKPVIRRWRRRSKVSIDGEVCQCESPLQIRLSDKPLRMVMPLITLDDADSVGAADALAMSAR